MVGVAMVVSLTGETDAAAGFIYLLRPYWKPRAEGLHPSGHPHIFLENGTQTVKMQFDTIPQKIQNRCNLHPCGDENYSGFYVCHTVTRMQECILRSHSTFCIR